MKRRPFTKPMIQVIETKFKTKLTPEQIAAGIVELEYEKGFGITTIEVVIARSYVDDNMVSVSANFKGDSYRYLSGYTTNNRLKNMLDKI